MAHTSNRRKRRNQKLIPPQIDLGRKETTAQFQEWAEDVTLALNADVRRMVNVAVVGGGGGTTVGDGTSGLIIQEEGVDLTQRPRLNFIGDTVTAADDAGNARTNVTITGYDTVQDEGTGLTKRRTINFIGPNVSVADDSGNERTNVTLTDDIGDEISVNGVEVDDPNFNDTTPTPPAGFQAFTHSVDHINAKWRTSGSPADVSCNVPKRPDLLYPGCMIGGRLGFTTTQNVSPFGTGAAGGTTGTTFVASARGHMRSLKFKTQDAQLQGTTTTLRLWVDETQTGMALSYPATAIAGTYEDFEASQYIEKGEPWGLRLKQVGAGGSAVWHWAAEYATTDGSSLLGNSREGETVGISTTEFIQLGTDVDFASTLEADAEIKVPFACTVSDLFIRTRNAQPGTGSLVFTIRKNQSDTAVTATVAAGGAAGVYGDTINSVAFAAGDTICLKVINNATNVSGQVSSVCVKMLQTDLDDDLGNLRQILVAGADALIAFGAVREYNGFYDFGTSNFSDSGNVTRTQSPVARDGVFRNLYLRAGRDSGTNNAVLTLTMYKNNVATALTITVAASLQPTQWLSNLSDTVSVSAGDLIHWRIEGTGGSGDNRIDSLCVEFALV